MGHEAYFLLLKKEKAKDSFEARKFVLWTLEEEREKRIFTGYYEPYIGGAFSGILSDTCGGKTILPYYNEEMRKVVREKISKYIPWIKEQIEKNRSKEISILAKELKNAIPEFKKYTDSDLLDALRLELYSMELNVDMNWHMTREIAYTFKHSGPSPDLWKNGRYEFIELGYEDDAMIVNECLYREIIDKENDRVKDIEKEKIIPGIIGKKWIVLVDRVD